MIARESTLMALLEQRANDLHRAAAEVLDLIADLRIEAGVRPAPLAAPKVLLTVDEAAARLSISRSAVYLLMASQELESRKIGRSRRVMASSVEAYAGRSA